MKNIGKWTIVRDAEALERAYALCRGSYQSDFLCGWHNLSGSTLRGKARMSGIHYQESRLNLLRRMTAAGIAWSEATGDHNARILVIG